MTGPEVAPVGRPQAVIGVLLFAVVSLVGPWVYLEKHLTDTVVVIAVAAWIAGFLIARPWAVALCLLTPVGFGLYFLSLHDWTLVDPSCGGKHQPICDASPGVVIVPVVVMAFTGIALGAGVAGAALWRRSPWGDGDMSVHGRQ